MKGWIKIDRNIQKHWIFEDPKKLQIWIGLLLMVNHEDNKVNIGLKVFDCKRGQSVRSLLSWANTFKVSKDYIRNVFNLLEKEGMILHENLTVSTRITICNYDSYQDTLNANPTTSKRKPNANQTQGHPNKNDKNDKNEKEDVCTPPKVSIDFNNYQTWIGKNTPKLLQIVKPLTEEQFFKIREKYSSIQIREVCKAMEAKKDFLKKYDNLNLTMQDWLKRQFKGSNSETTKQIGFQYPELPSKPVDFTSIYEEK
jgi:hypothetical protein